MPLALDSDLPSVDQVLGWQVFSKLSWQFFPRLGRPLALPSS